MTCVISWNYEITKELHIHHCKRVSSAYLNESRKVLEVTSFGQFISFLHQVFCFYKSVHMFVRTCRHGA